MSKEWWTIFVPGQQPNEHDRGAQQAREFLSLTVNLIRDERRIPFDDKRTYTFLNIKAAWKETVTKASKIFRFMPFYLAFAPVAQPDRATDF
jgi:hypothetical protein